MRLTAKQERFARRVALDGATLSDAYRDAYDVANPKSPAVWTRASELMRNSKVADRVQDLNEQAALRAGCTRESLVEAIWGIVQKEERPEPRISAGRLIADMCGWIPKGGKTDDADAARAAILARLAELDPEALRAMAAMPVDALPGPTDEAGEPSA